MWVFTKRGFLSVVMKNAENQDSDNPAMVVRARSKQHLQNYFVNHQLIETPSADYAWRVEISFYELVDLMREIMDEIDYDNFKDACKDDEAYHGLLEKIWGFCFMFQIEIEDFGRLGMVKDPADAVVRRLTGGRDQRSSGPRNPGGANMHQHGTSRSVQSPQKDGVPVHGSRSALDPDGRQPAGDDPPVQPWYRRFFK